MKHLSFDDIRLLKNWEMAQLKAGVLGLRVEIRAMTNEILIEKPSLAMGSETLARYTNFDEVLAFMKGYEKNTK